MTVATGTLDANAETFVVSLFPGQKAKIRMTIASTITVTATDGDSAFTLPSGDAAAWTASDSIVIDAPGRYTFTASGTSGGTCAYEVVTWP
jgi:hypothetical protein